MSKIIKNVVLYKRGVKRMKILCDNAGSSSLKFQLYEMP